MELGSSELGLGAGYFFRDDITLAPGTLEGKKE